MSTTQSNRPTMSHMVINVRDIAATHDFYTEVLGFSQVGQIGEPGSQSDMRFYQGASPHHHDIACVQIREPESAPPVIDWSETPYGVLIGGGMPGIVHIALDYGSREAWLEQLEHLQKTGVEFLVRGNHGMTHSVYIADPDGNGIEVLYDLPREVWEDDINGALNHFEKLPSTGEESLHDDTNYPMFGKS